MRKELGEIIFSLENFDTRLENIVKASRTIIAIKETESLEDKSEVDIDDVHARMEREKQDLEQLIRSADEAQTMVHKYEKIATETDKQLKSIQGPF